jgi:hypothetical protein
MISWEKFKNRNNIKDLDISEQKRLYYVYKNDYYWKSSIGGNIVNIHSGFLLQENGFYLLKEDGFKIKLNL